jgi:hypothetical protein
MKKEREVRRERDRGKGKRDEKRKGPPGAI